MSLITIDEALRLREGKRLVFTNGVFDLLHVGHVRYLRHARSMGDLLLVGMNDDASVRRLGKGPERPINCLENRAEVLSALRCVDGVLAFDEDTPERVIEILRPEIHVKGGDYREEDLPEAKLVRNYGGVVHIIPLVMGQSTTEIVRKLRS